MRNAERPRGIQREICYVLLNLYKLYLQKDHWAQSANPPVEKSESPPHILERKPHPGRHQPNYRNPV